ncbi:hypothetical protein RMR21_025705 (plasmid) [Agrobacterium sp. rho-8.1]|nr:hypothetical protein [Agrobacterium sp. rho-8.1]
MHAPLGFYSIGLANINLKALARIAKDHSLPFIHLRGGQRGYDFASWTERKLEMLPGIANLLPPVTVVTTEIDITDSSLSLPVQNPPDNLLRLCHAADLFGANTLRLTARGYVSCNSWTELIHRWGSVTNKKFVVELHDPLWFNPSAAATFVKRCERAFIGILIDSQQVSLACRQFGVVQTEEALAIYEPIVRFAHVTDPGSGLTSPGTKMVFNLIANARAVHPIEAVFEWTGADRSPERATMAYAVAAQVWENFWERKDLS